MNWTRRPRLSQLVGAATESVEYAGTSALSVGTTAEELRAILPEIADTMRLARIAFAAITICGIVWFADKVGTAIVEALQ